MLWKVNSFCNCHSRVQPCTADEYVLLLNNFSHLNKITFLGLREAGWTYQWIAAHVGHNVSVVCCCFQQWFVEHSHTCRPGSGRPYSIDAHHDRRIVQSAVAAQTASREEIWAHVAPAVSSRTIGNCLLAAGLGSHVPLARLPLTPWLRQAWLLWCRERVN